MLQKASEGMGIRGTPEYMELVVSNCLVRDAPLPGGKPWLLGAYIQALGGAHVRSKKKFGLCAIEDKENVNPLIVKTAKMRF